MSKDKLELIESEEEMDSIFNDFLESTKNSDYNKVQSQLGDMRIMDYCDNNMNKIKKFLKTKVSKNIYFDTVSKFQELIKIRKSLND